MSDQPQQFQKKPVVIEAMNAGHTTSDYHDAYLWVERHVGSFDFYGENAPPTGLSIDPSDGRMVIRTLEGDMKVTPGDWIIRGVQGEFYPCKPDIFAATYEPVERAAGSAR